MPGIKTFGKNQQENMPHKKFKLFYHIWRFHVEVQNSQIQVRCRLEQVRYEV